ncbi:hypothetical protein ACFSQT_11810 [Mesorhizobium calcicola]|uniref:ATP-binding protein n=1 Tax=Mesorhizobium calcicola TaxID=1300310 RepID=A0ABW4WCH6_9HYPH
MFTVKADDIKNFNGDQLVELLRVLLYAEARKAGVPLRNVDVPLQITVADGGQDATVQWEGGKTSTDYFPGRDVIFQCKAKDYGDAQWEKEVWTKPTQAKTAKVKVLNDAVKGVLARGGTYIGVTAKPLVGTKPSDRVTAIERGIKAAGGDPAKLTAIRVYEGNTIAAWASTHPAVAVWIKQQKAAIELAGFSTLDQWGKRVDIASPPFVPSPDRKFSLGPTDADVIDFTQLAARLVDDLAEGGACARIWGASGIGKTRALHYALSTSTGALQGLTAANFIFCDFREVPLKVWDVANQIVKESSAAVLVVDGCSMDEARRLNDIARGDDSQLRVITLGPDGSDHDDYCQMIRPAQADRETIRGILKAGLAKAKADEIDYIATLCDGFPRIAVLATHSYDKRGILKSVDDVAEQILGAADVERDTVRALECLSLFERLAPDENPAGFDDIAETLVHIKGEQMYENLVIAAGKHLVDRNHGSMNAQPRPIADFLALRRLDYLRPSTLISFLDRAPSAHRNAMLARWRFLARSRTLSDVVHSLLHGAFADATDLLGPNAAQFLPSFTHVAPDRTGSALFFAIMRMPLDDLAAIPVTDGLLDALRLLASRSSSFRQAAQIVLRLSAVASTEGSPPIVDLMRQLFQIALAGTQADDRRRREALTETLDEDDPRIRRACVEALGAMIQTHISRSTDFEQIGAEPYRPEWAPADHDTIHGYFKWALERLLDIWRKTPELRPTIEEHIAGDLRNLLVPELLSTIEAFVREVVATSGHWFGATKSIGDWLYFDRPSPPDDFAAAVRALYDLTLPEDPVEQALLYSRFWVSDIHDPEKRYADNVDDPDFEYSARRAQALAADIARDPDQLARIVAAMSSREMNAPYPFAEVLAGHLPDPLGALEQAVTALDASGNRGGMAFVRALLSAIDRRLADQADQIAKLETIAESSAMLAASPMNIYTALRVTDKRLARLTAQVREGAIDTAQVVTISYGKGLAQVSPPALADFIKALVEREDGGAWAALEILSMVTHERNALTSEIVELVKAAILAPAIADGTDGNASNADYVHDRMLRLLAASGAIDDSFARAFALQIERACRSAGSRYGRPSDAIRSALAIVVKQAPNEVWPVLSGFYEIATRVERERLNAITSATKLFAYDVSRTGPGALFDTPLPLMLDWAVEDPDRRVAFLISFFPILQQQGEGWTWHPALQQLAHLYGASKRFQAALRLRIFPSSWGGSLNAHLTSFKDPLATWVDDPTLGDWASGMLEVVNRSLEDGLYGR